MNIFLKNFPQNPSCIKVGHIHSIWRKFYKGTKNLLLLGPKKWYFRRKIQLKTSRLNQSNEYFFEAPHKAPIASKWAIVYSIWRKFYKETKNLSLFCPKERYFRRKIPLTTNKLNWSNGLRSLPPVDKDKAARLGLLNFQDTFKWP